MFRRSRRCLIAGLILFCASATAELQLQLIQSQYLSSGQNTTQIDRYSSVGAKFQELGNFKFLNGGYGVELMGLASMDGTEQAYYAVPEMYLSFRPFKNSLSVSVGRKRMNWSHFDEEWRLGIWQPNVRWDYLHPISQGLTGVFVGLEETNVQVVGFITPVFMPDQGPQFQVENGEFHSSNRWFRQPTNRHSVLGEPTPINYQLARPSIESVVMNPGYGLAVTVGQELDGGWFKISAANKPINQLHLGIDGWHDIGTGNFNSVATVHPMVARHTLTTMELGYRSDSYLGWISVTEERPDRPTMPEEWEESSLYSSRFIGAVFSHRIPFEGLRNHWIKYGYMKLFEDIPAQNASSDNLESSIDRYPFSEVASFEWLAPVIARAALRLDLGLRYLYSLPERGGLLSAKAEWLWKRDLRIDLGVDILGSGIDDNDPKRGLMTLYRQNDRVIGGLTYVF